MIVIGIAGGTGSGKSSLVGRLLSSRIGEHISVLPHDHYYHSQESLPESVRMTDNWDHPDAIDTDLFLRHFDALLRGEEIERPDYCFHEHVRKPFPVLVKSKPILLIEGILIFAISKICDRLQWRFFLEVGADERILRRIHRDLQERNRTLDSIVDQYRRTARPMHEQWIEPSRQRAHLILPNHTPESMDACSEIIEGFLISKLAERTLDESIHALE